MAAAFSYYIDLIDKMRRNRGPHAMRPKRIQLSSATTGQVWSLEPRPTSTSRQPVLPRRVTSSPCRQKSRSSRRHRCCRRA